MKTLFSLLIISSFIFAASPCSKYIPIPMDGGVTVVPLCQKSTSDNTDLTQNLKDIITYMYSEERLAYDVYMNIYNIQPVQQLQNIATRSEIKHIDIVNSLAIKYDLNITKYPDTDKPYSTDDLLRYGSGQYPVEPIQELYNLLYDKGIQSKQAALEVGCMVEVTDINDLNEDIAVAQASGEQDVVDAFNTLRSGSYNHYWSFDKGLKNMGISDGCCSLGASYCHPEYPQNEQGNGGGQGQNNNSN